MRPSHCDSARASPRRAGNSLTALQIGMLWGTSSSGGLDSIYASLFRHLSSQGIEMRGVVAGPPGAAELSSGRLQFCAGSSTSLPSRLLGARRLVSRMLAEGRIDLVAAHFALYTVVALDRMRQHPLVVHFHGPWAAESNVEGGGHLSSAAKMLIERTVYKRADRAIVLSAAFAHLLCRQYGFDERRVRIVPGQVDLDRFSVEVSRADARLQLGWPLDRPILLAIRRLVERTGVYRLIEAMQIVVKAVPDALLFIGGTGKLGSQLERIVSDTGLQDKVRFLGFVSNSNLPLAYRAADLNVVPSVALEGFGLTAAEALAAGTPSLVTPIGGLPEIVGPLAPHLVCASERADDLAASIIAILKGRLSIPDSAACRAYARERFSPTAAAARTADVYREVA